MSKLTIHGTNGECFYPEHGETWDRARVNITENYLKFDPEGPTIEAFVKYRGLNKQQGYLRFTGDSVETLLQDCRAAIERGPGLNHLEEPDPGLKRVFWNLVIEEPTVEDSLESILSGLGELRRNVLIDMLRDDSEPPMGFTIDSAGAAEQLVRAMISAERSVALRRNSLGSECDMELKAASQATEIAYTEESERRINQKIDDRLEDQRRTAYTDLQDAVAKLKHLQAAPDAVADVTSQVFSEFYPEIDVNIGNKKTPTGANESSDVDTGSATDDSMTIDIDTREDRENRTSLLSDRFLPFAALLIPILLIVIVGGLLAAGVLPGMPPDDPTQPTLTANQSGPNQLEVTASGFQPGNYSLVATSGETEYEINSVRIDEVGKTILLTDIQPGSYSVRLLNSEGTAGSTEINMIGSENASSDAVSVQMTPSGNVTFNFNETNVSTYSYTIAPVSGNGSTAQGNFSISGTDRTQNVTIDNATTGKLYNVRLTATDTGTVVFEANITVPEGTSNAIYGDTLYPTVAGEVSNTIRGTHRESNLDNYDPVINQLLYEKFRFLGTS